MSFFKHVHDVVKKVVNNAGHELARVDPAPAVAHLASQIGEAGKEAVLKQATALAETSKSSHAANDNQSCRIMVISGVGGVGGVRSGHGTVGGGSHCWRWGCRGSTRL